MMKLKIAFLIIKTLLLITFLVVLFSNLNNIFNFAYDQFNKSIDDKYLNSIAEIRQKIDDVSAWYGLLPDEWTSRLLDGLERLIACNGFDNLVQIPWAF